MSQDPHPTPPNGPPSPNGFVPPKVPMFNAPPGTLWACALLILIHAVLQVMPADVDDGVLALLAFLPQHFLAESRAGHLSLHSWLTTVTYAFLHFDWLHVLVNVGFLLAFGSVIERRFGFLWFTTIFALSAIGGAFAQLAVSGPATGAMIGASAAVYGMMGGVLALMLRGGGPTRSGGFTFIIVLMGINVVVGLLSGNTALFGATIAWQAHIGGFAVGMVLAWVLSLLVPPPGWRR